MAEISYPEDWRDIPAEQFARMMMTPEQYTAMRAERLAGEELAPNIGDKAPDFNLERLSGSGKRTGEMVALSRHLANSQGRPVGLIFGSYTWPPFRIQAVRLNEIAAQFSDRVDFFCIYIQEAHPDDGWQVRHNLDDNIILNAPGSIEERAEIAEVCVLRLNMAMPMLLDDLTDQADRLYNALPERLYLIDGQGIVRFKTVAGSRGFAPEDWAAAIADMAGPPT